jgi:hypothetical protein
MLDNYRKAVAAGIRSRITGLRECSPHAGRFDLAELRRISSRTPAVYVAILGIPGIHEAPTGEKDLELAMGIYVVAGDRDGITRDVAAVNIVEALTLLIPGNHWGMSDVFAAGSVKASNLYSGDVDRRAVALWGISFRQTVRTGEDIWGDNGTLPTDIYLGLAPDIGTGHEDDYTLVAEADDA